jgi:hypothetical protein
MRLLPALLLLLPVAQAGAQPPDLAQRLGLAEARNGSWCLATGAENVAPGTQLLLYEPYQGMRGAARIAAGGGEECGELRSRFIWPRQPDAPVRLYRIQPQNGDAIGALAGAGALFAVLGRSDGPSRSGPDLDGDGTPELFRICSASEGLHFLVERGDAVLWHAYYHLGLDVEPNCPERVYAE